MATTEQVSAELERLNQRRRDVVMASLAASSFIAPYDGERCAMMARKLHAGMTALAQSWHADAAALDESKHGAKKRRADLVAAAEHLAGFAGGLVSTAFLDTLTLDATAAAEIAQTAQTVEPEPEMPAPQAVNVEEVAAFLRGEASDYTVTEPIQEEPPMTVPFASPHIPAQTVAPAFEFVAPATGPERLSWDAFAEMVAGLEPPERASFSMITSLADCGMAYALDRLARREQITPSVPTWWNVGGTAYHRATEHIERAVLTGAPIAAYLAEAIWHGHFGTVVAETEKESGVSPTLWRAADKGREGYDWWRVQGVEMLKSYIGYHDETWRQTHQILILPDGRPALELSLSLDLGGAFEGWPFEVVIDQVWRGPDSLLIRDLKAGKSKQPSTFQLGGYAHALANEIAGPPGQAIRISGAFWDARSGSHDLEVDDLLSKHPLAELHYRARAAREQTISRAYLPRVSIFGGGCSSCGHRAICPAQS